MSINFSNLEFEITKKIVGGSLSTNEILVYTRAIEKLRSGAVFYAETFSALPSYLSVIGQLWYVNADKTVYIAINNALNSGWIALEKISNQLWLWGRNTEGQLGDGTTVDKCSPVREITSGGKWKNIAFNNCTHFAIKSDGSLWSWGHNNLGRLGNGTIVNSCSPVREISSSNNWCRVGGAVAIKTDGTLWTWGSNFTGKLGDGTTVDKCSPVREISSSNNWCITQEGTSHMTAMKSDGSIWAWGNNLFTQLGDGTGTCRCSPVREISSSTWCTMTTNCYTNGARKYDQSLWAWGNNAAGQLGNRSTVDRCSPVREITSSTNWSTVSSGGNTMSGIKTDGSLWSWGCNLCGSLGDGTTVNKCSPVKEISNSTSWCLVSRSIGNSVVGIKVDGSLWLWGCGFCGVLAQQGNVFSQCSPVREITCGNNWIEASIGYNSASAKKSSTIV